MTYSAYQKKLISREAFQRSRAKHHYKVFIGDVSALKEFYLNCPEGYQIDHIKPLYAGGPHDASNLQYLTPEENKAKAKTDIQLYGSFVSSEAIKRGIANRRAKGYVSHNKGKAMSDETKEKIRKTRESRNLNVVPEERKQKISNTLRNKNMVPPEGIEPSFPL